MLGASGMADLGGGESATNGEAQLGYYQSSVICILLRARNS